jgi:hypothetical protein
MDLKAFMKIAVRRSDRDVRTALAQPALRF